MKLKNRFDRTPPNKNLDIKKLHAWSGFRIRIGDYSAISKNSLETIKIHLEGIIK